METLAALARAVDEYDAVAAAEHARKALDEGIDPVAAFDAMTAAIKTIGDDFEAGTRWLPDLIGAADAMKAAAPILEEALKARGGERQSLGKVVAGTVQGDIHSIGIEMVCTLLIAAGFEVHYLGIDVPAQKFVDAVRDTGADVVALSALLTVTSLEDKKVIELLTEQGLRDQVKVMVGGGAINADFAASIGADGYEPAAPGAVQLALSFVGAA
ncbi:MAG TPA: cobalamin-dependent protein [Thermoleophilia bacterium]|jgi:methanogenic corrinoid protein MtbC1|nr:cobalamin-dependent protein [Acidobacteriota bacterium]NLT91864.1 cobalamin-binding protein [Actinomycetota bacterium]OPZ46384.1 MAG: Methionine synthase [Actinobacteria bacterium ADurb.BinA094]HQF51984.1 cobalamin-dependent protein [Thermoleophilia bacterium]HQH21236.1 cobalamin-dependent protein [Thermoleophilia bacterium]